jgi:hypothetical protein
MAAVAYRDERDAGSERGPRADGAIERPVGEASSATGSDGPGSPCCGNAPRRPEVRGPQPTSRTTFPSFPPATKRS